MARKWFCTAPSVWPPPDDVDMNSPLLGADICWQEFDSGEERNKHVARDHPEWHVALYGKRRSTAPPGSRDR